ncbi:hypothetical protein [Pseudoclavibacter terrae]|uniref:Uncharacterized protein n=1 Tax=Pseudoclavibacter terrae TaxID=1530195 RepID=A0A7J5B6Q6_9MICO|nr:hypothetical protein [Pseudoclavibacter terrae]KAB1639875.1 hypothetical protein F8O03_06080 [Pseudoclavibacter terrae]
MPETDVLFNISGPGAVNHRIVGDNLVIDRVVNGKVVEVGKIVGNVRGAAGIPGGLTPPQQMIFDTMQAEVAALKKMLEDQQLDILISKSDGPLSGGFRPTWHTAIRVGPERTYKTFDAAVTYARTLPGAAFFSQGTYFKNNATRGRRLVDNRVLILFDPGTYQQTDLGLTTVSDGIDFVGVGAAREDVVLKTNTINYNLRTWGSTYVKNLTIWHDQGPTGNNYCYHMNNVTGTYGYTNLFDNVWFRDTNSASSGCVGVDGQDGQLLAFYRCKFTSTRAVTASRLVIHDMPGNRHGFQLMFVDCEIDQPEGGSNFGLVPIGASSTGGVEYQTWRVGCKTTAGVAISDKYWVGTTEQGTIAAIPWPSNAMRAIDAGKYTPRLTPGVHQPTATTTAVALVPRRLYYVPLGVTGSAFVHYMELVLTTAPTPVTQSIAMGLFLEFQNVDGTWPGRPSDAYVNTTLDYNSTGVKRGNPGTNILNPAAPNKLGFDARTRVWLAATSSIAENLVQGSTTFSDGTNCWYETITGNVPQSAAATLTRVPAGDAVPIPRVVLT